MRTWEMIKELTENPNKKFRDKHNHTIFVDKDGFIMLEGSNYAKTTDLFRKNIYTKWEEIKQPVDFMTAFNAWYLEGKTIVYELDGSIYRIFDNEIVKFSPREIKHAKWFVED